MHGRPGISSHSLGRAWVHDLSLKLDAAARYGFDIELFHEDLLHVVKASPGRESQPEGHHAAAHIVRSMCDERGIKIICLQPFRDFEGLRDLGQYQKKIEELKHWIQIATILQTDLIVIPSTTLPQSQASGDVDLIVADLRKCAEIGAAAGVRFAYESLCWGTYSNTWEQSWDLVTKVDRSNFGICLDTFNIAGKVYADPTLATGIAPNGEQDLRFSMKALVDIVDVDRIMLVQVVDAERLSQPLVDGHELYNPEQPALMSWSRSCRLFYGEVERRAYLPINLILKAIFTDLGYDGPVSAELFNSSLVENDSLVPEKHACRAAASWHTMVRDYDLVDKQEPRFSSAQLQRQLTAWAQL